jgi:hypothetical protein
MLGNLPLATTLPPTLKPQAHELKKVGERICKNGQPSQS